MKVTGPVKLGPLLSVSFSIQSLGKKNDTFPSPPWIVNLPLPGILLISSTVLYVPIGIEKLYSPKFGLPKTETRCPHAGIPWPVRSSVKSLQGGKAALAVADGIHTDAAAADARAADAADAARLPPCCVRFFLLGVVRLPFSSRALFVFITLLIL